MPSNPLTDHHPGEQRVPSRSIVTRIAEWRILTTVSFALVAAALLGLLVVNKTVYEPRVARSVDGTQVMRLAHEAMLNQESSLRGFLLSGDDRFLEPFEAGSSELPELNEQAERLLSSDRSMQRLFLDVRLAQAAWIDGWTDEALAAGRRQQTNEALLVEGKVLFDAYRETNDRLLGKLIARRTDAMQDQERLILWTAGLALLAAVVLGVASFHRGRALRRSLDPALAGIFDHLERIKRGDLCAGRALEGPSELQRIDAGLQETATALAVSRAESEANAQRVMAQNQQLSEVLRLAREVAGSLNLRYVLRAVCSAASAIADDRRVVVWLRSEDEPTVVPSADTAGPGLAPVGLDPLALGEGVVGRAARFGRVEGHGDDLLESEAGGSDDLAIPMVVGAEVIGVLQLCGEGVGSLPRETLDVLEALAVQAATAIGSARLHEQTETMAMTDVLTHLPNRRRLDIDLPTEAGVSTRYRRPLSFAMLDVDHFKAYNDVLGHQAADVALQELAGVLTGSIRTGDTVYRYGGEEIAVILRETDGAGALHQAERLRAAVEHHFAAPSQPRPVTVSVGVAAMPEHAVTAEALVAAADAALYAAKRGGRNRCISAITIDASTPTVSTAPTVR